MKPNSLASISLADSVAANIEQKVSGSDSPFSETTDQAGHAALASINISDAVVKELHQTVNVNILGGDVEDLPSFLARNVHRRTKTRYVFVACGREIRAYDPFRVNQGGAPDHIYRLPDSMGSARSVRLARVQDRPHVLIGAQVGVVLFDLETAAAQVYPFPRATQHGANSVAILGEFIYASHSDFGLSRWPLGGGVAAPVLPDILKEGCRGVQVGETGQLLVCTGDAVFGLDATCSKSGLRLFQAPEGDPLVGTVQHGQHVYAATSSGRILQWDKEIPSSQPCTCARLSVKLYDLSLTPIAGRFRLVPSARDGKVHIVRLGTSISTTHHHAPDGVILRFARATDDLVVAVNAAGTRLYLWDSDQTAHHRSELSLQDTGRAVINDLCLLST
jgi:hypothetical protein